MSTSLLDSSRSLSIHIFDLLMNVTKGNTNANDSTFLIIVLLIINAIAAWLASKYNYDIYSLSSCPKLFHPARF